MAEIPNPSAEQAAIIAAIAEHNVIVQAVAGSGKTTLALQIARHYPDWRILLFVYNARLKAETRDKAANMGLDGLEVHSFHSYTYKYWDKSCYTDTAIIAFACSGREPAIPGGSECDLCIIDESQDITLGYHKILAWQLRNRTPKLMFMGDSRQCIYGFSGADARYLTHADTIWPGIRPWLRMTLSVTYRMTRSIVNFVNYCSGTQSLKPRELAENGPQPKFLLQPKNDPGMAKRMAKHIVEKINELLATGYKPDDIFILAPSVLATSADRRKASDYYNPIAMLSDELTANTDLIFHANNDNKYTEELSRHKVVFCTYHKAKGLERRVVFVMSFGGAYYEYFAKDGDQRAMSNPMYVAITRARELLIPVCFGATPMFMPPMTVQDYCVVECPIARNGLPPVEQFREVQKLVKQDEYNSDKTVTQLVKNISVGRTMDAFDFVDLFMESGASDEHTIVMDTVTDQVSDSHRALVEIREDVSALTGMIAEQCYFEGNSSAAKIAGSIVNECSVAPGMKWMKKQVNDLSWITDADIAVMRRNMAAEFGGIPRNTIKRQTPRTTGFGEYGIADIVGKTDIEIEYDDRRVIYELKFVSALNDEHKSQLLLYAWQYSKSAVLRPDDMFVLYNIRTRERWQLSASREELDAAVHALLRPVQYTSSDEEFIRIALAAKSGDLARIDEGPSGEIRAVIAAMASLDIKNLEDPRVVAAFGDVKRAKKAIRRHVKGLGGRVVIKNNNDVHVTMPIVAAAAVAKDETIPAEIQALIAAMERGNIKSMLDPRVSAVFGDNMKAAKGALRRAAKLSGLKLSIKKTGELTVKRDSAPKVVTPAQLTPNSGQDVRSGLPWGSML